MSKEVLFLRPILEHFPQPQQVPAPDECCKLHAFLVETHRGVGTDMLRPREFRVLSTEKGNARKSHREALCCILYNRAV